MKSVITGLGMACSLGGVTAASAAIRAGITRPSPLEYHPLLSDGPEPAFVTGHPVRGLTEGYSFVGRWIRLAHAALLDLARYAALPDGRNRTFWSRTALIAAVPDDIEERFPAREPIDDEYILVKYLAKVVSFLAWPIERGRMQISRRGHAGGVDGLRLAMEGIVRGSFDRVVVLAADSFLEPTSLDWLSQRHRLKTPDHPTGLIPGEAGACFVVESERAALHRQGRAEAALESAIVLEERGFDENSGQRLGPALGRAVEGALRGSSARLPFEGDVLCDLNGNEHRANDFGAMLARLGPGVIGGGARVRAPCAELGDTGAASGAVAVCLAVRSLTRRYAREPTVLITSRNDDGNVGAACLSQPNGEQRW